MLNKLMNENIRASKREFYLSIEKEEFFTFIF